MNLPESEFRQYADNTFDYLMELKSLSSTLDIFKGFYKCSDLKLNCDKTSAIRLGSMKG